MKIQEVFTRFPVLESANLILKEIEVCDLEDLFAIYSNDKVFEYCGIIPKHHIETIKNMIQHFKRDYNKKARIKWGIFLKNDRGRLTGIIEVSDFNPKVDMATVGYFLAEAYWGKGIASEALRMIVGFLFEKVRLNRIQAEVMPGNELSKKVLTKNGFIYEGTLRQASLWSGKGVVDLEVYGILKGDYKVHNVLQGS